MSLLEVPPLYNIFRGRTTTPGPSVHTTTTATMCAIPHLPPPYSYSRYAITGRETGKFNYLIYPNLTAAFSITSRLITCTLLRS